MLTRNTTKTLEELINLVQKLPSYESNNFLKSLVSQFEKKGRLSERQIECLENSLARDAETQNLLRNVEPRVEEWDIYISFKKQYRERGFLTEKQLDFLRKHQY